MDRRTLQRLIREWLRRLSLHGWHIDVLLVPHSLLQAHHGAGSYAADISPDPQHQRALMRVCRRQDMAEAGLDPNAVEETLVHELLHIRLDPMSHLANDAAFEVGLDALAEEFVRLARVERGRRRKP